MGVSALPPYLGAAFALHALPGGARAAKIGTPMAAAAAPIIQFQKFFGKLGGRWAAAMRWQRRSMVLKSSPKEC